MTQINRDCLGCMSLENIYALFTITRNIQEVSARSYLFINTKGKTDILNSKTEKSMWMDIPAL